MIPPEHAAAAYALHFGQAPAALCCAPGRINLIGEHIDYAGGCVLPMAVERGICCAAGTGAEGRLTVISDRFGGAVGTLPLDSPGPAEPPYGGLLRALMAESGLGGATLCFCSDLPAGQGLSSSAAFCVCALGALLALAPGPPRWSALELAQACRRAELSALGVPCGLMDQFASVFGRAAHAVLLDTASLKHEYIPLPAQGAHFLLVDSGQPRQLAASGYAQRRAEMDAALATLELHRPAGGGIRDQDAAALRHAVAQLPPPLDRRLRHAVTEQHRVLQFAAALPGGDLPWLGQLLSASHNSLSEDYEVSTPEIDRLCDLVTSCPGVYGARLMGGGFGGSVIALASPGAGSAMAEALAQYALETRLNATFNEAVSGPGAFLVDPASGKRTQLVEWLG